MYIIQIMTMAALDLVAEIFQINLGYILISTPNQETRPPSQYAWLVTCLLSLFCISVGFHNNPIACRKQEYAL